MKSLHGTYLKEHFGEGRMDRTFGFCNIAVHSNPFEWIVVDVVCVSQIIGTTSIEWARGQSLFWIFHNTHQVSAEHHDQSFLQNIVKTAQEIYVLGV